MELLTGQDLIEYLRIYNADIDWAPHLEQLTKQVLRRTTNPEAAKEMRWKQAACTILLPLHDKHAITDPPENLLFKCCTYHQFSSRDWVDDLQKIHTRNQSISQIRNECLELGVVYPLEYNPNTRQAYRWLVEHSKERNDWIESYTNKKMENLVHIYGGAVICSIFMKPELKNKIYKILNWRSGYFFEQLIHDVYKSEEIIKIKSQELKKIKHSDPKLIKIIRPQNNMETLND